MEVVFAPAFLRILKKFDPQIKEGVKAAVAAVIDYYETGQKTFVLAGSHDDVRHFLRRL